MSTALRLVLVPQDSSDSLLVGEVRRGNDEAFAELYSRYSSRIGVYVHGMVGDHGRAEDITQEIFIAALRRMRETERPIAFKPWIYEIAKNACIDSYRRNRRAQEVSLDADENLSSADRGRLTPVTTLDAELDTKQALHDLRGAFGGLSDSHHEILVLRELEGRSYEDIGERLGMSRPVVESTLFRARRRLAQEYEELTSGRRCEFVRRMVDSGPHYSLGIRDRRRMARHFAHCQECRSHARLAGFDESILNMPSVTSRIAIMLPVPLLRDRLGALEREVVSGPRERPSLLAFRSIHSLARSSDQLVGAGVGAGRAGATAAALVLAGVGGGIATVTSYQSHGSGSRAIAHGSHRPGHGSVPRRLNVSIGEKAPGYAVSVATVAAASRAPSAPPRAAARVGARARGLGSAKLGSSRKTSGGSSTPGPPHGPTSTGTPATGGQNVAAAGAAPGPASAAPGASFPVGLGTGILPAGGIGLPAGTGGGSPNAAGGASAPTEGGSTGGLTDGGPAGLPPTLPAPPTIPAVPPVVPELTATIANTLGLDGTASAAPASGDGTGAAANAAPATGGGPS